MKKQKNSLKNTFTKTIIKYTFNIIYIYYFIYSHSKYLSLKLCFITFFL